MTRTITAAQQLREKITDIEVPLPSHGGPTHPTASAAVTSFHSVAKTPYGWQTVTSKFAPSARTQAEEKCQLQNARYAQHYRSK